MGGIWKLCVFTSLNFGLLWAVDETINLRSIDSYPKILSPFSTDSPCENCQPNSEVNCTDEIVIDFSIWSCCVNGSVWSISAKNGNRLELNFDIIDGPDLKLTIYDGIFFHDTPILAEFTGSNYNPKIESSESSISLKFSQATKDTLFRGSCKQKPINEADDGILAPRYFFGTDDGYITSSMENDKWKFMTYLIKLPGPSFPLRENQIRLRFDYMNIGDTENSWINVREGTGELGRFTGSSKVTDLVTRTDFLNITIQNSNTSVFGFSLYYSRTHDACSCSNFTGPSRSGKLHLPYFSRQQYCNNMICEYRITVQETCSVQVTFDHLSLAKHDSLTLYNGAIYSGDLITRLYGTILPKPMKADSNVMTIVFQTDSDYVSTGFSLRYNSSCEKLSMTNIVGLVVGLLVFIVLFGGSLCFCCLRYRANRRNSRLQSGMINGHPDICVTGPNGNPIAPPPTYDIALTLPSARGAEANVSSPPPPSYDSVIKADNDAMQNATPTRGNVIELTDRLDSISGCSSGYLSISVPNSEHSV